MFSILSTITAVIALFIGMTFCFFGLFSDYSVTDEEGFSEKYPNYHPLMIFVGSIFIILSILFFS